MSRKIKVAGAQVDIRLGDTAYNLAKMLDWIDKAAKAGADLVIFPELNLTGYVFDDPVAPMAMGQTVPGPATEEVARLCRDRGVSVMFGLMEDSGYGVFNSAALVDAQGEIGLFRKAHLPPLGVDCFLKPGDMAFPVYETDLGRFGCVICYDGSFPESVRAAALNGAELVALMTNWPDDPDSANSREYLVPARAIENHIHYCAVNRVGTEGGIRFAGGSRFVDCTGATVAQAGFEEEELILAEFDLDQVRRGRTLVGEAKYSVNRLADRRPDLYGVLSETDGEETV